MSKDYIIKLIQRGNVGDQLTEILRNGARALSTGDFSEALWRRCSARMLPGCGIRHWPPEGRLA